MNARRGDGQALRTLAREFGLQTAYTSTTGRRCVASVDSLRAVLKALGAPADSPDETSDALHRLQQRHWPPNVVAWDGVVPGIEPPPDTEPGSISAVITLENGAAELRPGVSFQSSGNGRPSFRLDLPEPLPAGVHCLELNTAGETTLSSLFSAPRTCYTGNHHAGRSMGIFMPLYALRSAHDWGIGDLGDLDHLGHWARLSGCRWIGTLPLLACYLEEPFDPSPYAPISRLFWNELYCQVGAADELTIAPEARRLLSSGPLEAEAERLRNEKLVDYRRAMNLKRRVLDLLADAAFQSPSRRRELERFLEEHPGVVDYARFRAVAEHHRSTWQSWPQRQRDGEVRDGDFDERSYRHHLYAQWLVQRQLEDLSRRNRARACELYLDLPVGVHAGGYDVWRQRDQFATGLSVGAPPDDFFHAGQNWGFPPIHPHRSHRDGHRHFRTVIANHLRFAGMLRIDHVMALHRLFCIPEGATPADGVYVRYPTEELYAILSIESHRHRAQIVGENLGTVPAEVTRTMKRHRVLGMQIAQFEFQPDSEQAIPAVPAGNLAALNTHDVPTFAAYWSGEDIVQRRQLGLIDEGQQAKDVRERERMKNAILRYLREPGSVGRSPGPEEVLDAVTGMLAESDADVLLINLEDMWLEMLPQNVPGITGYPSWRRRSARTLEEITHDKALLERLQRLASLRAHQHAPAIVDMIGMRHA